MFQPLLRWKQIYKSQILGEMFTEMRIRQDFPYAIKKW